MNENANAHIMLTQWGFCGRLTFSICAPRKHASQEAFARLPKAHMFSYTHRILPRTRESVQPWGKPGASSMASGATAPSSGISVGQHDDSLEYLSRFFLVGHDFNHFCWCGWQSCQSM